MDEVATQEDKEFEALISLAEQTAGQTDERRTNMNEFGSEDEEYDGLCMQLVSEVEGEDTSTKGFQSASADVGQEMDVSIG